MDFHWVIVLCGGHQPSLKASADGASGAGCDYPGAEAARCRWRCRSCSPSTFSGRRSEA